MACTGADRNKLDIPSNQPFQYGSLFVRSIRQIYESVPAGGFNFDSFAVASVSAQSDSSSSVIASFVNGGVGSTAPPDSPNAESVAQMPVALLGLE